MSDDYIQGEISEAVEPQQGFTVEPTGMMAQVKEEPDSGPLGADVDEVRREWEKAHPGVELPETSRMTQEEILGREAALDVPTEGVIMSDPEPAVLEESEAMASRGMITEILAPAEKAPVTIGRIVSYRSRTGNYTVPAIVTCTTDSIYQPGVEAGFVPPLTSPAHVHLTVFTPGTPGLRTLTNEDTPVAGAENFVVKSQYPISENVSGCYQEWDIPYDALCSPGTWCWPTRM